MGTVYQQGRNLGDFLAYETPHMSREDRQLSAGIAKIGTPLAELTADGSTVLFDPAGVDGSEIPVAFAIKAVDATLNPVRVPCIERLAKVVAKEIQWPVGTTELQKQAALDVLKGQHLLAK